MISSSLKLRLLLIAILPAMAGSFACSSPLQEAPDGSSGGSGGAAPQASGGSTTGGAASGGRASGGSSSGGAGNGGTTTGGASNSGGSRSSGGSGPSGGGPSSGGAGTGGDEGGSGGSSSAAQPSAGCSKGSSTFTVQNAKVGYPEGYDGTTPFPVIFAFHAAGNNNSQLENQFGNTVLGDDHVMIYLQASGSGWNYQMDRSRYETAYAQVLEDGCVDENRVFALGHSSGAQMIVQLLCGGTTDFDAVVPIASSVYCSGWDPVPALVIHGLDDQERCAYGLDDCDGRKDIVPYRSSNDCTETKTPTDLEVGSQCGGNIDPGCVEFEGCGTPTYFCNHNDPQYSNTNHGIPCFSTAVISDFLGRL